MSKKDIINASLDGLLNKDAQKEQETTAEAPKVKTVCYYISPKLDEDIRYIAYYDRKKINEVVAEAFAQYIKNWKPAPNPKPKKL